MVGIYSVKNKFPGNYLKNLAISPYLSNSGKIIWYEICVEGQSAEIYAQFSFEDSHTAP